MEDRARRFVDIESDGTSFVVDSSVAGGVVVHWGAPLGGLDADGLETTARSLALPIPTGALDVVAPVGIVAEHGSGYPGHPGLRGPAA